MLRLEVDKIDTRHQSHDDVEPIVVDTRIEDGRNAWMLDASSCRCPGDGQAVTVDQLRRRLHWPATSHSSMSSPLWCHGWSETAQPGASRSFTSSCCQSCKKLGDGEPRHWRELRTTVRPNSSSLTTCANVQPSWTQLIHPLLKQIEGGPTGGDRRTADPTLWCAPGWGRSR